jgi:hypothetical protein
MVVSRPLRCFVGTVTRLGSVTVALLLSARFASAICGNNCLLVNDSSDLTHGSCDFSAIGTCSLRDAITKSNAIQGWSIQFAIGSGHQTISLMSNLPDIITRGTIDGRTQPGFAGVPLIEIHRADAGTATRGLHMTTDGLVTVRALVINHFNGVCAGCGGIVLDNPGTNFILGCYIGTDASGMVADGNSIGIADGTHGGNTYGGTTSSDRNVISGNGDSINIAPGYSLQNVIQGNYIGTNALGTASLPNAVGIVELGAPFPGFTAGIVIGGPLGSGAGNVIVSGGDAIRLNSGVGDLVQGNLIGLDKTGLVSLPTTNGIFLNGESNASILNNFISVLQYGIVLEPGAPGAFTTCTSPPSANTCGAKVQGNYIGTDVTGNNVLVDGLAGVWFQGAQNNTLGGNALAGEGNVIGGFQEGVYSNTLANKGNVIMGNRIGIGVTGSPIPNLFTGISAFDNQETIGGENPGEGNIIAFNGMGFAGAVPGVAVQNGTKNKISGNSIYANTGKGIDFNFPFTISPYPNDHCDADTGPNNYQNYPVITAVTPGSSTRIQGTLDSVAGAPYRLEFFVNTTCYQSGYGPGQTFLGYFDVTTDASCGTNFDVTFSVATTSGQAITATATDQSGNTSEFSACFIAPPSFNTLPPCRVVDTRDAAGPYGGPSLAAGAQRTFVMAGRCGIPSTATSVALNVIAIFPSSPGFLTLFPGGTTVPFTSTVNYIPGKVRANNAIIPLGPLHDLAVVCGQASGTVDMVIDVNGYFQ